MSCPRRTHSGIANGLDVTVVKVLWPTPFPSILQWQNAIKSCRLCWSLLMTNSLQMVVSFLKPIQGSCFVSKNVIWFLTQFQCIECNIQPFIQKWVPIWKCCSAGWCWQTACYRWTSSSHLCLWAFWTQSKKASHFGPILSFLDPI